MFSQIFSSLKQCRWSDSNLGVSILAEITNVQQKFSWKRPPSTNFATSVCAILIFLVDVVDAVDADQSSNFLSVAPEIRPVPSDGVLIVREGESASLSCEIIKGSPTPEITWKRKVRIVAVEHHIVQIGTTVIDALGTSLISPLEGAEWKAKPSHASYYFKHSYFMSVSDFVYLLKQGKDIFGRLLYLLLKRVYLLASTIYNKLAHWR